MIKEVEPIPIPRSELSHLGNTIVAAVQQARAGRVEAGYFRLMTGLNRARLAQALGVSWAAQLTEHYELALRRYTRQQLLANTREPL